MACYITGILSLFKKLFYMKIVYKQTPKVYLKLNFKSKLVENCFMR